MNAVKAPRRQAALRTLTPVRSSLLQRKCVCGSAFGPAGECEECSQKRLQKTGNTDLGTRNDLSIPPIVNEVLRSPGQPLDADTRAFMEPRFGHDFSGVRVHSDSRAADSARAVSALAYTVGADVVFAEGQYAPRTASGRRLLAHELTHVAQQENAPSNSTRPLLSQENDPYERAARSNENFISEKIRSDAVPLIQRQTLFGPAAAGAPANWQERVGAARTSSERAALVQEAVGITTVDRTRESAGDSSPNAAHLIAFTSADRRINYDDNLAAKRSPVDGRALTNNAGYTLSSGASHYIVLGSRALDPNDFFDTRITLNHEFDHIRQAEAHSALRGNESEVDAWTSTFIREFHRDYVLGVRGSVCYVHRLAEFTPLLSYFMRSDVTDTVRDQCVRRIVAYYNATLRSHPGHSRVFRFWIHRTLKRAADRADLARRLNTELRLGVTPDDDLATTRQFDCAGVREAAFPNSPAVEPPAAGTRSGDGGAAPGSRRFGLELGGGIALPRGELSAALSLGARFSLRSDQAIVFNPLIGARLLYLPSVGDRTTHLAAAIGDVGLRLQQPLRGAYLDVRAGGYVGLQLPTPGPRVEGGPTAAVGLGYRWERLELGVEGRWMRDVGSSTDRFVIFGVGGLSF